ncbi:MAG: pyridoxal phosphate-dependent aminotransferase [Patescibacteria group bacterium]|jgi:aspartate aminotransferase
MIKLSKRISAVTPSGTIMLDQLAKQLITTGKPVINLTAGELSNNPDAQVITVAQQALQQDCHHYSAVAGMPLLREAIANYLLETQQLAYQPNQILITNGVKQAIYTCLQGLLNEGDEVIILLPAWVSYIEQIKLAGGKPVFVHTTATFHLDSSAIARAITPKTKGVIINSPNNPTGAVYSKFELQELVPIIQQHQLWVLSDEVYEQLYFTKEHKPCSIATLLPDQTIIVNGISKCSAMTGWRLGFIAAPVFLINALTALQSHLCGNVANIVQIAAKTAITLIPKTSARYRASLNKQRTAIKQWVKQETRITLQLPQGAFYAFINITSVTTDSVVFCERLLAKYQVALVPGKFFGQDGFVRLSFTKAVPMLQTALERLTQCLDDYK